MVASFEDATTDEKKKVKKSQISSDLFKSNRHLGIEHVLMKLDLLLSL